MPSSTMHDVDGSHLLFPAFPSRVGHSGSGKFVGMGEVVVEVVLDGLELDDELVLWELVVDEVVGAVEEVGVVEENEAAEEAVVEGGLVVIKEVVVVEEVAGDVEDVIEDTLDDGMEELESVGVAVEVEGLIGFPASVLE